MSYPFNTQQQAFVDKAFTQNSRMRAATNTLAGGNASAVVTLASNWGITLTTSDAQGIIAEYNNTNPNRLAQAVDWKDGQGKFC